MARAASELHQLQRRLGLAFSDENLLEQALTHASSLALGASRTASYQRLEFLGDRVLGLAVADMLRRAFGDSDEGELSRRLAELVRRESCAEVAAEWQLGAFVRLGDSEMQAGGARKTAILADVCESLIGAVFVDAGFEAAQKLVASAWMARMHAPRRPLRDAKTQLQEWAQGVGLPPPSYSEVERSGPAHAPHFVLAVEVVGHERFVASGASKRVAEQAAARGFLDRLEHDAKSRAGNKRSGG